MKTRKVRSYENPPENENSESYELQGLNLEQAGETSPRSCFSARGGVPIGTAGSNSSNILILTLRSVSLHSHVCILK